MNRPIAAFASCAPRPFSALLTASRPIVTASVAGWAQTSRYLALSDKKRAAFVPPPRGRFLTKSVCSSPDGIETPKQFLAAIGRATADVADKFKSWDHLFTATTEEMADELAIPVRKRKYILQWREWYKRGVTLREIAVPERRKKYLKLKKEVQAARLKKKGMA
ncbi:hypothetical protein HDU83_009272 [Entophlyctis luteolus]|nr:hypothetical protein HDU83_009272 [Entophlyctis luteolus]